MRELGDDVTYGQTHTRTQPFIVKDLGEKTDKIKLYLVKCF